MNTLSRWIVTGAAFMFACTPPAVGQTLYDPSFELATNPLPPLPEVLGPPTFVSGFWAAEVSFVVDFADGITPYDGQQMLQMWDDGISVTQAFQAIDVSAIADCIDAGGVGITFLARFNAPSLPEELGGVEVGFYACDGCWGQDLAPTIHSGIYLDGSPSTSESVSTSGTIPVGTRWLAVQVHFRDTTLEGRAGYVDSAELQIDCAPPTPAQPNTWGRIKARYQ
jgi:hypothetical protein